MIVYGSPSRYVQGRGVLARAGEELAAFGKSAVLLIDPTIRASIGAALEQSCKSAAMTVVSHDFGGECGPA